MHVRERTLEQGKRGKRMTMAEFRQTVNSWRGLIQFCIANNIDDVCNDVVLEIDLNDFITSDIAESLYEYVWTDLRDILNNINPNYSAYKRVDTLKYVPLGARDFMAYKQAVSSWMTNHGRWDVEEATDDWGFVNELAEIVDELDDLTEEDVGLSEESEPPAQCEDFSVNDLISMCSAQYKEAMSHDKAGVH